MKNTYKETLINEIVDFMREKHDPIAGGVTEEQVSDHMKISVEDVHELLIKEAHKCCESRVSVRMNQDPNITWKQGCEKPYRWFVKDKK